VLALEEVEVMLVSLGPEGRAAEAVKALVEHTHALVSFPAH